MELTFIYSMTNELGEPSEDVDAEEDCVCFASKDWVLRLLI